MLLATGMFATGMLALVASTAGAASAFHVDPQGNDAHDGSVDHPLATIAHAVQRADNGDTVVIHPGRYHESVQVFEKQINLVAAPGAAAGDVVLDGSVPLETFTADADAWWASWSTSFERASMPFTTADRPEAGWPEQFFMNGVALNEVASRGALSAGSFFYDSEAQRVWFADDPDDHLVEGSDLTWGLYLNRAHGSTVSGLTVQRYATPTSDMAAVRAYANDLVVSDVTVRDNARIGLSVIGESVQLHAPVAIANGHLGLHAHHSTDLAITGATVVGNNRAGFDAHHSAGGFKITESTGLLFQSSSVIGNGGPGIWTDLSVDDAVIASNTVMRNGRSGIEIELSSDVIVVDNVVERNGEAGVWVLESSQVQVWHNQVFGNVRDIWIEDGPRSDVNDVVVANNLLGGDDRPDAATAILNVDDWTEERAAADMNITTGSNRYWLVPGSATTAVSRWANWPSPLAISDDADQHRLATGQGVDSDVSVAATNPYASAPGDAQQIASPAGWTMPPRVAAAARWSGDEMPAGPINVHRDLETGSNEDSAVVAPTVQPATQPATQPAPQPTAQPPTLAIAIPVEAARVADRLAPGVDARNRSGDAVLTAVEAQQLPTTPDRAEYATAPAVTQATVHPRHGWSSFRDTISRLLDDAA